MNDFSLVLSVACAAVGGGDCGDEESGDFISGLGSSPLTVDLRGESSPVSIDYSLQVLGDSLVEPDEVVTYLEETLALCLIFYVYVYPTRSQLITQEK